MAKYLCGIFHACSVIIPSVMQDEELEQELAKLRGLSIPGLPGNIQSRVWRSIQRREETSQPVLFAWPLWLAQPVMALVFLVGTTGFGFFYGSAYDGDLRGGSEGRQLAWADAFDADSLYLPSSALPGRDR